MAKRIPCPLRCRGGYVQSSGDGWDEWDECRCCNPKGENASGTVSEARLAKFKADEAAAEAHVNELIARWEAQPCECGRGLSHKECGGDCFIAQSKEQ